MTEGVPNAADEFRLSADAARRKWHERRREIFWRRMLADPIGRSELWRLLDDLNTFRTEFKIAPAGIPDKYATWFWHGRSTFGFDLYQQMMVIDRGAVLAMHDENDLRFLPEPQEPSREDERDPE